MKKINISIVLLFVTVICFAQNTDTLSLSKNEIKHLKAISGFYDSYLTWTNAIVIVLGFSVFSYLLYWFLSEKVVNYFKKKAENALEEVVNLKSKKRILVLSSKDASEDFLHSFFRAKFDMDKNKQIEFRRIENEKIDFNIKYDVVFVNNENGKINRDIARQYVGENNVIFYFGPTNSWDFANDNELIKNRLNLANSRTQIYGNLINSLEYLECIKPKYSN